MLKRGLTAVLGLGLALTSLGQDAAPKYLKWMDAAQELKDEIRDALEAKAGAKAASGAQKMAGILQDTEKYWASVKISEAVRMTQETLTVVKDLATFAKAGKMPEATAAFLKMEKSCQMCHDSHFDKQVK